MCVLCMCVTVLHVYACVYYEWCVRVLHVYACACMSVCLWSEAHCKIGLTTEKASGCEGTRMGIEHVQDVKKGKYINLLIVTCRCKANTHSPSTEDVQWMMGVYLCANVWFVKAIPRTQN